jgi:hypothetical protein
MHTNPDAHFLHLLSTDPVLHKNNAERLRTIADNLQRLADMTERFAPNHFDDGYLYAPVRMQGKSNLPEGRTIDRTSAEIIKRAITAGRVTRVPLGKRTLDPVTGRPFEEAATPSPVFAFRKSKKTREVKPSVLDSINLDDLNDINL